jgi:hypothetical protein
MVITLFSTVRHGPRPGSAGFVTFNPPHIILTQKIFGNGSRAPAGMPARAQRRRWANSKLSQDVKHPPHGPM